jgi:DNA invertase Pin-like site-specific DNA recombinase
MKVIAYIRTSTKDQLAAYGPERQREAITAWATAGRHRVIDEVIEDISGTLAPFSRPGWCGAIQRCCNGEASGAVVADLSRLTRDQVHLELTLDEMSDCAARLFSTAGEEQSMLDNPDDPQRKLIRVIIAAINEYDRSMIVSRMQAGRRIKKAGGGYAGGQPPFGYRGGDGSAQLVPHEREQTVLARMRQLHEDGGMTAAEVADVLNDAELFNRKGGRWSSTSVARLLRREQAQVGQNT